MLDITFDITALFILLLGAICLFFRRKMDKKILQLLVFLLLAEIVFCLYSIFSYGIRIGLFRIDFYAETLLLYFYIMVLSAYPYLM